MTLEENIQKFEESLLSPEVRSNESSVAALLADDFVEFGASGQVWNKREVIAGLKTEIFVARSISNVQVRTLAEGVVLVTYVCQSTTTSLRSSIWRLNGGNWQMTFHQGTRLE